MWSYQEYCDPTLSLRKPPLNKNLPNKKFKTMPPPSYEIPEWIWTFFFKKSSSKAPPQATFIITLFNSWKERTGVKYVIESLPSLPSHPEEHVHFTHLAQAVALGWKINKRNSEAQDKLQHCLKILYGLPFQHNPGTKIILFSNV